ncbi:MAG: hypothetical protein ACHQIL_01540 [Steroidobacterales bacterium]
MPKKLCGLCRISTSSASAAISETVVDQDDCLLVEAKWWQAAAVCALPAFQFRPLDTHQLLEGAVAPDPMGRRTGIGYDNASRGNRANRKFGPPRHANFSHHHHIERGALAAERRIMKAGGILGGVRPLLHAELINRAFGDPGSKFLRVSDVF